LTTRSILATSDPDGQVADPSLAESTWLATMSTRKYAKILSTLLYSFLRNKTVITLQMQPVGEEVR